MQREVADAVKVELPEGDARAVGTPAEAVVEIELLLVDPVGAAVDHQVGAVAREACDRAGREILDVDVVLPHVGDLASHRG